MGAPPLPADCKQSRPASLGGGAEGYFQALLSDRSSPEPGRQLRSGPLHRPAHHRGAPRAHLGGEQRWIQSLHRGTSGPVTRESKKFVGNGVATVRLLLLQCSAMLYGIQGLSAGFFVSASRFLHVAGVLLVLLPSVLDHGASHRQKTGLRRWGSAGAPFR